MNNNGNGSDWITWDKSSLDQRHSVPNSDQFKLHPWDGGALAVEPYQQIYNGFPWGSANLLSCNGALRAGAVWQLKPCSDAAHIVHIREPPDRSSGVVQPDTFGLTDHISHPTVHWHGDGHILQAGCSVRS